MKLLFTFFLGAFGNAIMHHIMTETLIEKLEITDTATKLMLMMNPNLFGGSDHQVDQMNPLLPMLLMDSGDSSNSKLMMIMMMQNGGAMNDMNGMLPMLMMGDDELDFKSLFLMTSMMEKGIFTYFVTKFIFCLLNF